MTVDDSLAPLAAEVLQEAPTLIEWVRPVVPPSRLSLIDDRATYGTMLLDLFRRRPPKSAAAQRARSMPRLVVLAVGADRLALLDAAGSAPGAVYEAERSAVRIVLKDGDPYGFVLSAAGEVIVELQLADLNSEAADRLRLVADQEGG